MVGESGGKMDMSAIGAALGSIKTLLDLATTSGNAALQVKMTAEIAAIQSQLIQAQSAAVEVDARNQALTKKVAELEKEAAEREKFAREKERYRLTQISRGVFVYVGPHDVAMEGSNLPVEPAHCLCPACFQNEKKAILQVRFVGMATDSLDCPLCQASYRSIRSDQNYPFPSEHA